MKKRRTLQDLTIKDNFLFGAVMHVEENCKGFLELVLGFPIAHVVVSKERSMIYHPEYKGVRLDIYAEDENHTHYNVEMQMRRKKALGKRSRYYHSQIVMEALESGEEYDTLPATFGIGLCEIDPFGKELYCYTFQNECKEDRNVKLEDGCCTIFLSTQGKKEELVSPDLVRFLKFVMADLEERFQKTIREIQADREMGGRYMIFEEMLREEKQEGKIEGAIEATQEAVLELLEDLGEIPRKLQEKIEGQEDLGKLKVLHKMAARADSIGAFEKEAEAYLCSEEAK